MGVILRQAWREEWKLMDSINEISCYLNKCQALSNTSEMTFFLSWRQRIGAHALCVQHSPTASALLTSFLLNHARPTTPSCTHWLQDLGSYAAACIGPYESRVKKTEEIKDRHVEVWQCTDTAFEWKMRFSCFPVLPGSEEAHVIWGGTVKHLLIAYFVGNISSKKYQNVFTCVKVIANQMWDVFSDTV